MASYSKYQIGRALQRAIIVALFCWSLFFGVAVFRGLFWLAPGDSGLLTDTRLFVISTDPQTGALYSPAARLGIRVGDRIDSDGVSFADRLHLLGNYNVRPGSTMHLRVFHAGISRRLALTAAQAYVPPDETIFQVVIALVGLIFTVVGAIVVSFQPSIMTWAFFLGCLGLQQGLYFFMYWLPAVFDYAAENSYDLIWAAGYAGFLIFAARVPDNRATTFGRYMERLAPIVFVLLLAASVVNGYPYYISSWLSATADKMQYIVVVVWALVVLTLLERFLGARAPDRRRIGWILAGFSVAFGSRAIGLAPMAQTPFWGNAVPVLQAAIPLSVAHTMMRYRTFQAGVVANRAIVYGLLVAVVFCAVSLLDWVVARRFANSPFQVGLIVALAIGFGYFLRGFHRSAIRMTDRLFFRRRYETMVALERVQSSLGSSPPGETGLNALAQDVADALGVASVAFFRRSTDGGFVRISAIGWDRATCWHLLPQDTFLRSLNLRSTVLSLSDGYADGVRLPAGALRPAAGVAVSNKGSVEYLVLVGATLSGTEPDHDSLRIVKSIVSEATRQRP